MTQEREAFSDLPPLPEPRTLSRGDEDGTIQLGYTADQMHAYARASVAQPASVPAGWKLVPVEPTDDMLANVDEEVGGHCHSCTKWNASWSDCRRVYAAMLAAAPQAPQPAQADMAPEYAAAVRELAEQSDMSEAQVLRAAIRLYQAERKGLVTVKHKEQIGPLAAPQPEAQPHMVQALKDAIEGECDGLSITDAHAKAILEYVLAAPSAQAEQGGK